ncbi:MAG: hypothetical protein NTY17_00725, partial [Planctomycetia bacterium]|nr:hypothetical protein [Planctomycetia bacterium]
MPRRNDLQKLNPDLAHLHTLLGRRAFLGGSATAASMAAMSALLSRDAIASPALPSLHFAPRA